ncbi:MAG TPA: 3-dehydroquinate synthase, partial [Usitatibacter sp.]
MSAPLRVDLGERSYDIHIGGGLIASASLFTPHVAGRTAAIVTNETVAPLFAARVEATLVAAGARVLR